MRISAFFDNNTGTVTYIVIDEATFECAIIDSVLDYNVNSKSVNTTSADQLIAYIQQHNFKLRWILETHVHADHLTAAAYIKQKLGGKIGIGIGVLEVLAHWAPQFKALDILVDGSQFDELFVDGARFNIGKQVVEVLFTPGHTPSCVSYLIDDAIFVGDVLFMPHKGTGRVDFPGGSAAELYSSIENIYSLAESTRVFTGHDYPKINEDAVWESTVYKHKNENILLNDQVSYEDFIKLRTERDKSLSEPRLLHPAIEVNLSAGKISGIINLVEEPCFT